MRWFSAPVRIRACLCVCVCAFARRRVCVRESGHALDSGTFQFACIFVRVCAC